MSDQLATRSHHRRPNARSLMLAVWIIVAGAGTATADGWKIQLQGVKALGLGYAGRALADDATTVWFNPAAMTDLDQRWVVTVGAPMITFDLDYTDRGSTSVLGMPLTGPSASNGGRTSGLIHAYGVWKSSERLAVGFGFNPPYGLGNDYGDIWVGRYHATRSELAVLNISSAVAYKVHPKLSLGFGLDIQRSTATLANRLDFGSFGAAIGLPVVPQGADGGINLDASSWGIGIDASAAWQVTPRVRLATTYRSMVEHTLEGPATFDVPVPALPLAGLGAFQTTPATTTLLMPHELSIAGAFELSRRWTVVADFTWTDWSQFEELTVSFDNLAQLPLSQRADFRDTKRVAMGVVYDAHPRWVVRAGGLYEQTPVPDATRTPRLPEVNNAGITFGGTFHLTPKVDLDFSWSHLIPHDAPIALVDPAAGALNGSVRWRTDSVAIGTSFSF